MSETALWRIGAPTGHSADLVDTYKQPNLLGDVTWTVDAEGQRWPLFHPSEADPLGGYRSHPYTVAFALDHAPHGAYLLRVAYLTIAPRLAHLELTVNGTMGRAYLRPSPSRSGEIRLLAGLHTAIYAEGVAEVVVPAPLLRRGENRLVLVTRDGGEVVTVVGDERINRLDRMANGAGLIYQCLDFAQLDDEPEGTLRCYELRPSVVYLRDPDGGETLRERCHLYLELNAGVDAGGVSLDLDTARGTEHAGWAVPSTAFGHIHLPFEVSDGEGPVRYKLGVTFDKTSSRREGTFRRRRKWTVYVAPHAHTDIGYTHRQWEVAERLCHNIDTALDMIGEAGAPHPPLPDAGEGSGVRDASFAYHLDSSWALDTYLATRGEGRRRQVLEAVRAGRLDVPGAYVDVLTHTAALEDLIRNGEFTEGLLRPAGLRSDFSTVVDVASISGALPALLEGSGVRYLVHANNQDRGPFRLNGGLHRLSPYYWQGTHSGRVLVWLSKMYCELRKVCGSPPVPDAAARGLELWLDEYERDSYAPDSVLLYGQEADNTDLDPGPAAFMQRWNDTYAYPRLRPCAVSQFFRDVEARFGGALSTVRGDGGAYWEDGAGSTIVPTMRLRAAQAALPAAETLEALAVAHTPDWAYPLAYYDEAWRQVLLSEEHTWGAFLSGNDPASLLQRDQWSVKGHFIEEAAQWSGRLLHAGATRHSLNWNNEGREVVVYNPHSWPCGGPVTVEIARGERVFDPATGREVSTRPLAKTTTQATVELWIDEVPGLGYRRFVLRAAIPLAQLYAHPQEEPSPPAPRLTGPSDPSRGSDGPVRLSLPAGDGVMVPVTLENAHYRLVVDVERGHAVSLIDKALGRELVDGRDAWGMGQFLYARGGEGTRLIGNHGDLPEGDPEVLAAFSLAGYDVARFDHGTILTLTGAAPYGELTVAWMLYDGAKLIDLRYTYRKEERTAKEAVYVAFPFDLPGAAVRSDAQLGWVNWDQDELPGGCKEWLPLQSSVLVQDAEASVLLLSPDIPLFCVGDVVRGRWPKEADLTGGRIFSYVLNNYWHTNYKASQGGEITFRYAITSDRAIPYERAFRLGRQARRPLYAQRMSLQDFRSARSPYERADGGVLARIDSDEGSAGEVVLSTLKGARWGAGFVARLQEIAGRPGRAIISFPGRPIAGAWATDLLERELGALPVGPDGTLRIDVPAWGLATVRFTIEDVL